ncbi:7208_t:CDS:2 [Dentiscutata heterogama]|uniref:7208_t:CDS:1 n=1 Tax=Dentiscutata heterogama TaxID=1316150 RepID=A0ACA9JZE7_9GLOM|nr:7208_t:CDS:2 [Dentiscutata heterogama]
MPQIKSNKRTLRIQNFDQFGFKIKTIVLRKNKIAARLFFLKLTDFDSSNTGTEIPENITIKDYTGQIEELNFKSKMKKHLYHPYLSKFYKFNREMFKDGTFSMSKSQRTGRRIFKLGQIINIPKKYRIKDIHAGDMYKSHEFDRISCFILSNYLNDFQLCIKNQETKEWEAIFWFDKMDTFSVNHSSEIVGINRNKHLELYSRINDSIQKTIIDVETQEQLDLVSR